MPSSCNYEAITLRTSDVGEADRFCIFFTRDRGRLAARANAVRRPGSKSGALLLPLRHAIVELVETSSGFIVRSAALPEDHVPPPTGVRDFAMATEGTELLLLLLEDDEPIVPLFDATLHFLAACGSAPHASLGFTFCLLRHLGFLPDLRSSFFEECDASENIFLEKAVRGEFSQLPPVPNPARLNNIADYFLRDHLQRERKANAVAAILS